MRSLLLAFLSLLLLLLLLLPARARADEPALAADADDAGNAAHDALPGLVRLGVPAPLARGFALSAAGSYGYTGDVLGDADAHHRAGGTLALSFRPRAWLGLALRLDGRHDAHSGSSAGKDDGWIGDTRLELRLVAPRAAALPALAWGGSVTAWFPSARPFSPEADAVSFDLEGWLGWHVGSHLELVGGAGVRLDRSAASAPPDAERLSRADRLALGVGDGPMLLLGAGVFWTGRAATLYGEWTWDMPVGEGAPRPLESPMRADAGLRWRASSLGRPTFELSAEVALSKRPDLMAEVPLVPVEPRVTLLAAASWSFGGGRAVTIAHPPDGGGAVAAPPTQHVRGRLVTPTGEPLAGVRVHIGDRATTTDAQGGFELDGVPAGEVRLEADLPLPWARISTTVVVGGTAPLVLGDVPVERALPPGQIRGVVRTLTGKPVRADVTLLPIGQHLVAGEAGDFRIDVPPGEYDVVVEAPGFAPQKRHVVVDENGVTVLNVDLRKARPEKPQDQP